MGDMAMHDASSSCCLPGPRQIGPQTPSPQNSHLRAETYSAEPSVESTTRCCCGRGLYRCLGRLGSRPC